MPGLTPNSRAESGISMAMPNQPPQHPSHHPSQLAADGADGSLERSLTRAEAKDLVRFALRRLREERLPQVAGSLTFTTTLALSSSNWRKARLAGYGLCSNNTPAGRLGSLATAHSTRHWPRR